MTPPLPSVLITRRMPSAALANLREVCDVDLHPGTDDLPPDVLCARLRGKQGLICMFNDRVDSSVIDAGDALRVIATVAVGFDNIDVAAAKSRGIVVTNTPDILTGATAEFTWALIVASGRPTERSGVVAGPAGRSISCVAGSFAGSSSASSGRGELAARWPQWRQRSVCMRCSLRGPGRGWRVT